MQWDSLADPSLTLSIPKNSTTYTETKDNPVEKNGSNASTISLVAMVFVLLLLVIIVVIVFVVVMRNRARVKNIKLDDKAQIQGSDTQNGDHQLPNVNTLEISNPSYIYQRRKKATATEIGGIYSQVTTDKMYDEVKGGNVTIITVATDGQVITGAYNIVTPLTLPPVRSTSEIIESAAYASIQANSNQT